MADLRQNFSTGTVGSAVSTTNPSGDTPFNQVNLGTATMNVDSSHGQSSKSAKIACVSGQVTSFRWTGQSGATNAVSVYLYMDTSTASGQDVYLITLDDGATVSMRVTVGNASNKLRILDQRGSGTVVWTSTVSIPLNTLVRIDVYSTLSATAATIDIAFYLGDSTTAQDGTVITTGQTGTNNIQRCIIGKNDNSTYAGNLWLSGVRWVTGATGKLGPYPASAVSSGRPNAVVSNPGSFTQVGGTDIPGNLADESDTSYAQSPDSAVGAAFTVGYPLMNTGPITIKTRYQATGAGQNLKIDLLQNGTLISTRTITGASTSITDHAFTTTSGEAATITDRSQLQTKYTVN